MENITEKVIPILEKRNNLSVLFNEKVKEQLNIKGLPVFYVLGNSNDPLFTTENIEWSRQIVKGTSEKLYGIHDVGFIYSGKISLVSVINIFKSDDIQDIQIYVEECDDSIKNFGYHSGCVLRELVLKQK